MTKKLLTFALSMMMIAVVSEPGAAQNRSAANPLFPPANALTLSSSWYVYSLFGCPVTAWLHYTNNWAYTYPGQIVYFVPIGPGPVPSSGVTNANSQMGPRVVPWNRAVQARVQYGSTLIKSNTFACGSNWFPSR